MVGVFVAASVCGFVSLVISMVGGDSSLGQIVLIVSSVAATLLGLLLLVGRLCSLGSAKCAGNAVSTRWNAYMRELAQASREFFAFIDELGRNPRCQDILARHQGLDSFDSADYQFAVPPRLAAIVYCDVRDCYRRLGKSPASLNRLEGMGYAMFMTLLVVKGFDVKRFFDREQSRKLAEVIGELDHSLTLELDIQGHESESRFSVVFGLAGGEWDWVQRYSTLLYRWASLIAKADGTVTPEESETLAAIMAMQKPSPVASDGNVRVSGTGAPSGPAATMAEAMKALDALVGLAPVKAEVHKLASFIRIQRERERSGLKNASVSYHCVFTGNPGTGKTTVARIVADIYRTMGILKKGHLVETDRSGLVGGYVGQTAVKTNKIIDSALDGVLFIDEAYSLVQGGDNDYGAEAVATLLKRMEDDRDRLVVILAGYTDEMKRFVDSNPGLRSRFSRYICFPDYSAEELAKIFLSCAERNQYTCSRDVRNSIATVMEMAAAKKDRSFGNARYARNLFENAIQRQAVRLSGVAPLTPQMLSELTLHDLGFAYDD